MEKDSGTPQCPKCGHDKVEMVVDNDRLKARFVCSFCNSKSPEFTVKPANNAARMQAGYNV